MYLRYGDWAPVSHLGQSCGVLYAFVGVAMLANLAATFVNHQSDVRSIAVDFMKAFFNQSFCLFLRGRGGDLEKISFFEANCFGGTLFQIKKNDNFCKIFSC
jgi:hypothetical protein